MPEFLSPGVFIEEVDAGPKPIEGVSTSTAGAVGVTSFGPTSGKPVLVTSFADFVRIFGGSVPEPGGVILNQWNDSAEGGHWWRFPLSVKGFFDNGGERLFVKRVFASTAEAASGSLVGGLVSEITEDAAKDTDELKLQHLIGVHVDKKIEIFRGDRPDTPLAITDLKVAALDVVTGRIRLNKPLPEGIVAKRGDFVQIYERTPDQPANRTLTFQAKSLGKWGNSLRVRIRPMVGATLNILPSVTIPDPEPFKKLTDGVTAGGNPTTVKVTEQGFLNGDQVLIKGIAGKVFRVSNLGADGKTFVITPGLPAGSNLPSGTEVSLVRTNTTLVDEEARANPVKVVDIRDFRNGDHILVKGQEYVIQIIPNTSTFNVDPPLAPGQKWEPGTLVKRLHPANEPSGGAREISVRGAATLYKGALVELSTLSNGKEKELFTVDHVAGDAVTLSGSPGKPYFEGNKLRVIEAEVSVRNEPEGGPVVDEVFSNLRLINDGSLSSLVPHINTRSALIEVKQEAGFSASDIRHFPTASSGGRLELSRGDDKLEDLAPDDFVGVDRGSGQRTGIQALEDIDEISICLAPDIWAATVHSALILHCETLKDRFAILDPPPNLDNEGIRAFREPLDSKYAALYYPWIEVRDSFLRRNVQVAPSGHMAGIYARVDVERGVHKAPANEIIRGITKIADEVTKREQDLLNPKGINALRFFPGRGNRVWGARTISSDSSWKYINVRRLFLFVEESIDEGTQFVVFEPNAEPTWARVRQTITNFLTTVWRGGALEGTTADQAFFVKCDRTTMSQDDIDNGRLICVIGIAPVKPAEFVIFRIQQLVRTSNPT